MSQNPYTLAALATAAVPGIMPVYCHALKAPSEGLSSALVIDDQKRHWVVLAPSDANSGARLLREVGILQALSRTELAAYIQSPHGFAEIEQGGRAVVALALEGEAIERHPTLFASEKPQVPAIAADLGRILALVHNTAKYASEDAGVEEFTPKNVRRRHWENIKRAEKLHELPSAVTQRWMTLLAEDELWNFTPKFIHGDLNYENLLFVGDQISGILNFQNAAVSDPAQDIAWVMSVLDYESFETFHHAYTANLDQRQDSRLLDRAQLSAEFAVLEWLLAGSDTNNEQIVSEALQMLEEVNEDLAQLAREEAEEEMAKLEQERLDTEAEQSLNSPNSSGEQQDLEAEDFHPPKS